MDNQQLRWLAFSGKGEDFPAWSERFLAFCRTKNLYRTVLGKDIPPPEIAPLADGAEGPAIAEHTRQVATREKEIADMDTRKDTVWCYLAMSLDTTSLMYVRHDCRNEDGTSDGTKAWKMLQTRFCNIEKTTVRTMMAQLSQLKMCDPETMPEYLIRGQELATRVRQSGEQLSDSLLSTMVLNGLPDRFNQFAIQESFDPSTDFAQLRDRLESFNIARCPDRHEPPHIAMAMKGTRVSSAKPKGSCFVCGISGHFAKQCYKRNTAFCDNCRRKGHLAKACKDTGKDRDTKAMTATRSANFSKPNSSHMHFIVDTGCTDHMVNNRGCFSEFVSCDESVKSPDGSLTNVVGKGTVKCKMNDVNGEEVEVELKDVLCVPQYQSNLLSVRTSTERNVKFSFTADAAAIEFADGTRVRACTREGLYILNVRFQEAQILAAGCTSRVQKSASNEFETWHKRLGHLNKEDVLASVPECKIQGEQSTCETCVLGKQSRVPVPKVSDSRSEKALERVVTDVLGPLDTPSLNGHRWVVTFIDEFSRYSSVKFMNRKGEVIDKFREYLAEVGTPRVLRSDNEASTPVKLSETCV